MRDCSTCRDSRGLITRTCSSSPPRAHPIRGEEVETDVFAESLKTRDAAARPSAQSAESIDSRFLRRDRDCLCREIKLALFCASEDRSHSARANCAASRPDKLRAYKCSIRRRRLIVRAHVRFHTLRAPASSSRGRDCKGKLIRRECGIIPIDSLCRVIVRLSGIYLAEGNSHRTIKWNNCKQCDDFSPIKINSPFSNF